MPGRFEPVDEGQDFAVLVDYAHTPDSLQNVLAAARELIDASGRDGARVLCVIGAGGDRDRGKRPLMGEIATRLADSVVVTSDNPRSEDPEQIIAEIMAGVARVEAGRSAVPAGGDGNRQANPAARANGVSKASATSAAEATSATTTTPPADAVAVRSVADRAIAIDRAIAQARPGDVLVIAGKGHEQGQEFAGGRKLPFDDVDVARKSLRVRGGRA